MPYRQIVDQAPPNSQCEKGSGYPFQPITPFRVFRDLMANRDHTLLWTALARESSATYNPDPLANWNVLPWPV